MIYATWRTLNENELFMEYDSNAYVGTADDSLL
jgi:hypothetical protein